MVDQAMTAGNQPSSSGSATLGAVKLDEICLQIQGTIGWSNGADFEPDCCSCRECEAQRNEARDAVRLIASHIPSIAQAAPASLADALRKNCGATNGCSCADLNYQWYGEHCEATMTSVFRTMLKDAALSAVTPSPAQPPRTPLDLSAGELNMLATDAFREGAQGSAVAWIGEYDGHLDTTIYRDTMERWKALGRKITPLYAVTPSPGPDREGTLKMVAGLFSESVHDTYTREEVVSIVEDMIRVGRPASSVASTPRATPACDCGFTADVCATNRCHRKQIASAGLSPVPAGYSKLPDGVVCKCFKMWRAPDGSHWCCLPSPLPSTDRGAGK